jgi:hypothetical protein
MRRGPWRAEIAPWIVQPLCKNTCIRAPFVTGCSSATGQKAFVTGCSSDSLSPSLEQFDAAVQKTSDSQDVQIIHTTGDTVENAHG